MEKMKAPTKASALIEAILSRSKEKVNFNMVAGKNIIIICTVPVHVLTQLKEKNAPWAPWSRELRLYYLGFLVLAGVKN